MRELTVAASVVRGLLTVAAARGTPEEALAARAGIDFASLLDHEKRIPMADYVALMRAGKEMTGDPALALHYGEEIDLYKVSIVGLIGLASATTLEALAQLNRFGRLVIEVDVDAPERFALVKDADGLWMVDQRRNANDFPELTELTFSRFVCGSRSFADISFVTAVHVTHTRPAHADAYDRIFRAPITFGAKWNALRINPEWLVQPIARQPRYVFGVLCAHAEKMLEDLARLKTVRAEVESRLMPIIHTGTADVVKIAEQMGISRQTLFRRLKAENTSFADVHDALRRRMALQYLESAKVTVQETAYLVGFSDAAAFSRAFKRWTGASPRKFQSSVNTR